MHKWELRKLLRARLLAITPDQRKAKGIQACQRLVRTSEFAGAEAVMLFLSLPDEVDTTYAIRHALDVGKVVLVPKVDWDQGTMVPVLLESLDHLVTDRRGLHVPAGVREAPLERIDLLVAPGLGFDRQGRRLGRGSGFYDRLLADKRLRCISCGLCLAEQVVGRIPTTPSDRSVDMIVTDQELVRIRKGV